VIGLIGLLLTKNYLAVIFTYIAPVAFALIVIFMAKPRIQLPSGVSVYLGRISYPIYLMHLIFIPLFPKGSEHFFTFIAVLIIFSTLCYFGFERLFLRIRPSFVYAQSK
jgi:peptidoglycan/LPS O-acetylase OafA/YrhL